MIDEKLQLLYSFPERQKVYNDQLKDYENISPEIFSNKDNGPIEETIYYAVTFFENLSPGDFKRVVYWLLEEKKTTIKVKSEVITEQGEIKIFKQSQEKLMTEIWNEICKQPDQLLLNCHIYAVTLKDNSQVIDFFSIELREKFKDYFKHKQPFYLLEQYKKSRFLLFEQDEKVAKSARALFLDMASISPNTYGINWLMKIIEIIEIIRDLGVEKFRYELYLLELAKLLNNKYSRLLNFHFHILINQRRGSNPESTKNSELFEELELVERLLKGIKANKRGKMLLSKVLSLLSLTLDKRPNIVDSFLNELINQKKHDFVLEITQNLFYDSNFNGIWWFQQILNRCTTKGKAYEYLINYCQKSKRYVFDILEKIKEDWLPNTNDSNYSPSNKYALQLFPNYCCETIIDFDEKHYGSIPSQYPLLRALDIDNFEKKLNVFFAWLFHPGLDGALKEIVDNNKNLNLNKLFGRFGVEANEVEANFLLKYFSPLLFTEWCIILWGLDNKQPEPEALDMIHVLIQKVFVYPASSEKEYKERKEKFVQCWRRLAQDLLDKAVKSGKLGKSNPKKKYMHRRNIVKYLNKQFNLQIKKRNLIKE